MTPQKAIDFVHCCMHVSNKNVFEVRELAMQALEKQIPKKPNCKKYTDDTRCPVCNAFCSDSVFINIRN